MRGFVKSFDVAPVMLTSVSFREIRTPAKWYKTFMFKPNVRSTAYTKTKTPNLSPELKKKQNKRNQPDFFLL